MRADFDLAIVGSGFAGSILAMIARRIGLRTVLIERGRHPRFALGESASPLAGILIEELADRYDLPRLRPLSAFGTWQRVYPQVTCGLKRGFTYFKHRDGEIYRGDSGRGFELLVAASPSDELSDTHWLRADVDHFLVREAIALGAEYLDDTSLHAMERDPAAAVLTGQRAGRSIRLRVGFLVDASGPRGFVSRALGVADQGFSGYPGTQALLSHFTGVARCDGMREYERTETPPYPLDDAALHHVFDGGWMWVLRFGNGVTSAGVAVTDALAADLRLRDGEPAWRRLLARYPTVAAQFADARPTREFTWIPRLAYRGAVAAGERWAMLPSAAAFVDPLFSTGIPMTLLGIERLAGMLAAGRERSGEQLSAYGADLLAEADHTARFVAGCYAAFPSFGSFTAYSMFYFAAASFSEMARRLDAPVRPRRFLCADHPQFGPSTVRLAPAPALEGPAYSREVADAVECLNVAGLCDPAKRNWYGVDPEDAVRGAGKFGLDPAAVRAVVGRMMNPEAGKALS